MNRRQALGAGALLGAVTATPAAVAAPARTEKAALATSPGVVVASDGAALRYSEWGVGQPIVFLSSWALSGEMWSYQRLHLAAAGFRCICLDRRGHGRSDRPPSGYDMTRLAADVHDLVEQLDLTDAVLVGHSMGGAEAIHYLASHGSRRVRKLVLLAPVAPYIVQTPDNPYGAPAAFHEANLQRWSQDFPAWAESGKAAFFTPQTSPAMVEWLFRQLLETPPEIAVATFRALIGRDLRPDLKRIDRPTLVIHGDRDASAPLEITGRRVAAGVAGARLEVLSGAPHGLFVTHMEAVNSLMRDFLA